MGAAHPELCGGVHLALSTPEAVRAIGLQGHVHMSGDAVHNCWRAALRLPSHRKFSAKLTVSGRGSRTGIRSGFEIHAKAAPQVVRAISLSGEAQNSGLTNVNSSWAAHLKVI